MQYMKDKPALIFISFTYLLYFGQLGILTPYLGVFLDGRGFDSVEIGSLLALITLARIIGPAIWAGIADKTGKPLRVMQLGCCLTAVCFVPVFWVQGFALLTLVFALTMMFWTAVLPQLEVITLQQLKCSHCSYGSIRLWGSVGFILLVVITGEAIDVFGSESTIHISMVVLTLLFLSTLPIRSDTPSSKPEAAVGSWALALKKPFVVFMLSAVLLQMSFGCFYGFFALYMRQLGYSGMETGLLIALGVLAEIGIFLISGKIIARFGVRLILIVSIVLTAARWWMLAFYADWLMWVVISQCIHALSFGLTHATSVHFVHHFFPPQFQSRGLAIYISLSFGIGGAIGHYLSGVFWQSGQGAELAFVISGFMAMAGALVLFATSKKAMD